MPPYVFNGFMAQLTFRHVDNNQQPAPVQQPTAQTRAATGGQQLQSRQIIPSNQTFNCFLF